MSKPFLVPEYAVTRHQIDDPYNSPIIEPPQVPIRKGYEVYQDWHPVCSSCMHSYGVWVTQTWERVLARVET